MKSILWYVHLVVSLLLTVPKALRLKRLKAKCSPDAYSAYVHGFVRKFALTQVRLTGSSFDVKGQENIPKEGAVLFVSNHQSNFDIGIFLALIEREKGFIAKTELLKIPILRTWMKEIHCVFMDRSDIRKSAKAIGEGIKILKDGHCLVIFPEGTRSKSSQPGPFKAGSFKLATKSQAPIVPVSINGSRKIMEENNSKIKAAHVSVTVHPPIFTAELGQEELAALPERVRSVIVSGLEE